LDVKWARFGCSFNTSISAVSAAAENCGEVFSGFEVVVLLLSPWARTPCTSSHFESAINACLIAAHFEATPEHVCPIFGRILIDFDVLEGIRASVRVRIGSNY
jgi:hypothetical protein